MVLLASRVAPHFLLSVGSGDPAAAGDKRRGCTLGPVYPGSPGQHNGVDRHKITTTHVKRGNLSLLLFVLRSRADNCNHVYPVKEHEVCVIVAMIRRRMCRGNLHVIERLALLLALHTVISLVDFGQLWGQVIQLRSNLEAMHSLPSQSDSGVPAMTLRRHRTCSSCQEMHYSGGLSSKR